jgi:hypothetical protein
MLSLALLKAKKREPLCTITWIESVPTDEVSPVVGETFSLDGSQVIEGNDYRLMERILYPLSGDGRAVWQAGAEALAAITIGAVPEGIRVAVLAAIEIGTDEALVPYQADLVAASATVATDVRSVQGKCIEQLLGLEPGTSRLIRAIDFGEADLLSDAWKAISEALNAPVEGKAKAKGKGKKEATLPIIEAIAGAEVEAAAEAGF